MAATTLGSASSAPRDHLVIGSRTSALAMTQTHSVAGTLSHTCAHIRFDVKTEATIGDVQLQTHLADLAAGTPGLFTKELESGLLAGVYDLAVHSLKDMPTQLPAGLTLAAITQREDPRDALVMSQYWRERGVKSLAALPPGAVIGTSSVRREAMLRRLFPHLRVVAIRGNLNTRLKKLDAPRKEVGGDAADGASGGEAGGAAPAAPANLAVPSRGDVREDVQYDALVLAFAGLTRLGWNDRISAVLDTEDFPYGVSQGALGIECRADDEFTRSAALTLVHPETAVACLAERAFMRTLQGGCQVPIGVCSKLEAAPSARASSTATASTTESAPRICTYSLRGQILAADGSSCVEGSVSDVVEVPNRDLGVTAAEWSAMEEACSKIGVALANKLLRAGADAILGPQTAPRPITYGAAELPLDRPV